MPDYLNIAGRVRTTAADGVVAEAQEVKDLLKNKSQQELNNDFSTAIEAILLLIPSAASSLNQLADKAFVNSSIATASATFRGTYNLVSDLNLTVSATHAQIGAALASAVSDEDNNDYAFVQIPTSDATPTQIAKTERYKFNGTTWEYEYDLNNSGYTDDQWAAINSGITAALVSKLSALPTNEELTTALGLLSDGIAAINGKIPSEATTSNKLVDTAAMQSYVTQIINAIDATFNVTSTDGHVTVQITQVNGVITNVAVTTSDIASASALTLVTGRVTDAEANIVSLGGRMTTAETDIDDLQQLYNNLQQSAPVVIEPTDTWPVAVADRSATVIYRVVDRVNTTPQYYSDYMFRASDLSGQPVLMAQYDNAIDPRPKKGSQNLVTSGGVFDNMGALDVSELNATENPHTLAIYADLSAALAAIPSDYQKGGMSIKFVSSVDNKYVQYRLMSDEWSTNTEDWAISDDGVYVENSEFVEVHADAEDKILWAIQKDGNVYYGAGCPQQVKDYIEEKISSLSLDEYDNIVAFLSDYLGSDTTLKTLLDSKLDAEGLDPDALATVQAVENPEYIQVTTDNEDKILEGITINGTKKINIPVICNDIVETQGKIEQIIDNSEYAKIEADEDGKIINAIRKDGSAIVGGVDINSIPKLIEGYHPLVSGDFTPDMSLYAIVDLYNSKLDAYCTLCKCNINCMEKLSHSDSEEEVYRKINHNFREKNVVYTGMPSVAFASQLNKYFTVPVARFADAKINNTNGVNASLLVGDMSSTYEQESEPSALISSDGNKIELFCAIKGYIESSDGVNWSIPQALNLYDGVGSTTAFTYIRDFLHPSFHKIDGMYFMIRNIQENDGDTYMDLFTSENKIDWYYRGHLVRLGDEVSPGVYSSGELGNTYLFRDRDGTYYLLYETGTTVGNWWDINLQTCTDIFSAQENGFIGNWVQCSENPILNSARDGRPYCNPEIIKGQDNQPLRLNGEIYMIYLSFYSEGGVRYTTLRKAHSKDMIHWIDEGPIFDNRDIPTGGPDYADNGDQCLCEFKDRTYLFYTHDINIKQGAGEQHMTIRYTIDDRPQIELMNMCL